jgi:hypothetical protein
MPRVPELELLLDADSASQSGAFEVAFVDDVGEQRREPAAALSVPFESCHLVRRLASYKGQRHLGGQWWTATTGSLVARGRLRPRCLHHESQARRPPQIK